MVPAKVIVMCLTALIALALHGCSDNGEAAMIQSGQTFETASTQTLSSSQLTPISDATKAVVANPTDANALDGLKTAIANSGFADVFDTDNAVAKIENNMLTVNISMKPLMLVGGLIRLTRSKDDSTKGPIFALNIGLQSGSFDPAQIASDLLSSKVHIEGHVYVTMFCWGYFKLLVNNQGKKFHLEVQTMHVYEVLMASGLVTVSDTNEIRATGSLKSWFNDEMVAKVVKYIQDAAKPFTDAIEQANAEKKENCDKCAQNVLVNTAECTKCALGVVLDGVKAMAGNAFDTVAKLVEAVGQAITQIFSVDNASFDVQIDPNNLQSSTIEVNLEATVLFTKVGPHTYVLDVQKLEEGAEALAKLFAPQIFAAADAHNSR